MGLDVNGTQFILYAKELGIDLARTAMIGRQSLLLSPDELEKVLKKFGYKIDRRIIDRICEGEGGFADWYLRSLGADTVDSFDMSNYEGATYIHDLNLPIPEEFLDKYSVVLDGGALEHVFNFPAALKSCMQMVEPGGHYLAITPANNLFGHGFYQFSPELYFSVFTKENGFRLLDVIAFEDYPNSKWYSVKSPSAASGRVTLTNKRPVYLLVAAKRINGIEPLRSFPQQSDYLLDWHESASGKESGEPRRGVSDERGKLTNALLRKMPYGIKRFAKRLLTGTELEMPGFNPEFFTRIEPHGIQIPGENELRNF